MDSKSKLPIAALLTCNVFIRLPLRYRGKLMKLLYFVTTSGTEKKDTEESCWGKQQSKNSFSERCCRRGITL